MDQNQEESKQAQEGASSPDAAQQQNATALANAADKDRGGSKNRGSRSRSTSLTKRSPDIKAGENLVANLDKVDQKCADFIAHMSSDMAGTAAHIQEGHIHQVELLK